MAKQKEKEEGKEAASNNGRDQVFSVPTSRVEDFKFGKKVVSVFDDMVSRSVPFYGEMQRMIAELAADFAAKDSVVYDLGCSTGTTMIGMNELIDPTIKFVGIDESEEMLKKCDLKLKEANFTRPYELRDGNLNQGVQLEKASVVVLCLTLQFVRPLYREKLITDIYNQLPENGALIIVEKVLGEDSLFNRLFINYYYDFKRRNNYSEMEISQKREALENVLIPYKLMENREMLIQKQFRFVEVFFKWYNFCGLIAVK
jgi:tRNA (cmo5U34)-methyltransferase